MVRIILLVALTGLVLSACAAPEAIPMPQPTFPPPQATEQPTASLQGSSPPAPTVPPPLATNQPYAPQPGDSALLRQEVFLDSASVRNLDSDPATFVLDMRGNLPSPCNMLRVMVPAPDGQNQIQVDAYSVINPGEMCITIVQPFEVSVMLGKFPSGHYTVWVNGQQVGEFVEQ
jgi:hypothetical protein